MKVSSTLTSSCPLAIVVLLVFAIVAPNLPAQAEELNLYIAADGRDTNNGLSPRAPLATLQRVHDVIAERLATSPMPVRVHVGPGLYRNQLVRWSFSMRDHSIVIQGDPRKLPVFDGGAVGKLSNRQAEFFSISRGNRLDDGPSNVHISGLQIQNYLEAIWIRGIKSSHPGYGSSAGRNVIERNRFVNIGAAFTKLIPHRGRRVSHGAILIRGSRENIIRNNEFINITNDATFPSDYSTYGGLHAIYVMTFSSGTVIEGNIFSGVFARGVIKFRHFSNFGRVVRNHFDDDTSLLQNSYCDRDLPVCQKLPWIDCPSWGIEFTGNTYRYYRGPQKHRPTLDIPHHPANDNYCRSEKFWADSALDPQAPLNQIHSVSRVVSMGNRQCRKACRPER